MIRAGILGTGNIGTDLLIKLIKSDFINPVIFSGRRKNSKGIKLALKKNIKVSDRGIQFFIENSNFCDVIYDCTNALDARKHAKVFKKQHIRVFDLTPAKVGSFCIPGIYQKKTNNLNMITCGGQASIPLLHTISKHCNELKYIEVISQIAADSAGMATRLNIDDYIETTEKAIYQFTKAQKCKVILNLNPAVPQVNMQTTLFIRAKNFDFEPLVGSVYKKIIELKKTFHFTNY
jgi:acetaldehyde dehydrogenase